MFHLETTTLVARSLAAVAIAAILDPLVVEFHIVTPRIVMTHHQLTEALRLARSATAAPDCYCVTSCSSRMILHF